MLKFQVIFVIAASLFQGCIYCGVIGEPPLFETAAMYGSFGPGVGDNFFKLDRACSGTSQAEPYMAYGYNCGLQRYFTTFDGTASHLLEQDIFEQLAREHDQHRLEQDKLEQDRSSSGNTANRISEIKEKFILPKVQQYLMKKFQGSHKEPSKMNINTVAPSSPSSPEIPSSEQPHPNAEHSETPKKSSKNWLKRLLFSSSEDSNETATVRPINLGHQYDLHDIKILKQLGTGSGGKVYLALHTKTGKKVALKEFLHRKGKSVKDYSKRVAAEYCIQHSIHHPNVVEAMDLLYDERKERYYEVLEYCEHGDLFNHLKERSGNRMTQREALCILKQLLQGLVHIHALGVGHLDIKPENILEDGEHHWKFGDFGVSQVFKYVMADPGVAHRAQGCVGTIPYIAPEEFVHQHYDATKVDIWALGVTYVTMRLGHNPWVSAQVSGSPIIPCGKPMAESKCETCAESNKNPALAIKFAKNEMKHLNNNLQNDKVVNEQVDDENFDDKSCTKSPSSKDSFSDPRFDYFAHHKDTVFHEFGRIIAGPELEFVLRMLEMDPNKRANSQDLLDDPWFKQQTSNPCF